MQMISASPLGRLEWALRNQTFWCFPAVFQLQFQLSQLAAEETGVTFAYFSSVVPHFNTDVLTFFLCHFLLPPTSALSVVFGANCSIGGSDIKSRCGWLACLHKNLQSVWPTSKTNTTFVFFFFLKSFFSSIDSPPPKKKNVKTNTIRLFRVNVLISPLGEEAL